MRQRIAEGVIDEIFAYNRWDIGPKKGVDDIRLFTEICQPKGVPFLTSYGPAAGYSAIGEMVSDYDQGIQGITFLVKVGVLQTSLNGRCFLDSATSTKCDLRPREGSLPPERSAPSYGFTVGVSPQKTFATRSLHMRFSRMTTQSRLVNRIASTTRQRLSSSAGKKS